MCKIRIEKETHPNTEVVTYNTNVKVNDELVLNIENKKHLDIYKRDLSDVGYSLIESLLKVKGVQAVSINKYYVRVTKAKLFDWVNIDPIVQHIIRERIEAYEK